MFAVARRLLGSVKIEEKNSVITIEGISASAIERSLQKQYRTSRVYKNVFHITRGSKVGFYSFFAIEAEFMLRELIKSNFGYLSNALLRKVADELREYTWLNRLDKAHDDIIDKKKFNDFTWTPLPHQEEFLDIYNENVPKYDLKGYVLGAGMGSGKTFAALLTARCLGADTVIIVSPNNALDSPWRKTINSVYKKHVPVDLWVSNDKTEPTVGKTHYVVHYEYLSKFLAFFKENERSFKNVFIALDESHNFNESSATHSKRTSSFIELCESDQVKHVIWQSGTPVKAMGNEVIPMLKTITRNFTKGAEDNFRKIFGVNANRAIDILSHRIGLVTYRVVTPVEAPIVTRWEAKLKNGKEFTLKHIGEQMRDFILERMQYYESNMQHYVDEYFRCIESVRDKLNEKELAQYLAMTARMHRHYDPMVHKDEPKLANRYENNNIIPLLSASDKHAFRNARSVYKYYWLKVQGEALGRILGKERTRCSTELALSPDGFYNSELKETVTLPQLINMSHSKTVIFTNYINTVEKVAEYLRGEGFKPIVVHGNTKESVAQSVSRFDKDKEADPIITTYKSLSTAVPLTMASNSIMIDQPFREYERSQAIARTNRLGQKYQVLIHDLFLDTGTEDNISTRSEDILEWSMQQVQAIMGRTVVSEISLEDMGHKNIWLKNLVDVISLEDLANVNTPLQYNTFKQTVEKPKLLNW